MEAVKKYWFWGVFISILSIFAMSHNANAIDLSINLDNYSLRQSFNRPNFVMDFNNDTTTCVNTPSCIPVGNSWLEVKSLYTYQSHNYKKGDIVEFTVFIGTQSQTQYYNQNYPYLQINFNEENSNISYIGENVEDQMDVIQLDSFLGFGSDVSQNYTIIRSKYNDLKLHKYYFRVKNNFSGYIGFKSSNYNSRSYSLWNYLSTIDANGNFDGGVYFRGVSLRIYEFLGSEENREVEEKTQGAVDESETAGSGSSSQAQTGTTGLLNAITGAVSVISSAQPTNCKINGNMGNLDIGQLDLCANPAPAFVQTIGSLILILMCVPLAISLFNRFIAIFRSFQS